jgi:2-hydroxychromene-2-carboxylate isomerase
LVPALRDENFPEPDLLLRMSRVDAANIAPHYGLNFPTYGQAPAQALCDMAAGVLCRLSPTQFADFGVRASDCLWRGDLAGMQALIERFGRASDSEVAAAHRRGAARREHLKHYGGAMFWYEGEWYWGVDRLYHLEQRLTALDAVKDPAAPPVAPRPAIASIFPGAVRSMTLEYFPSLRSPHTAISWDPTMKLVKDSGIQLAVKPVLPMVMRGVPATFEKGLYIVADAAREARAMNVDYGRLYDPVGEPVLRGFSLYMWALQQGKGNELLGAFLKAAFAKGINTNCSSGLRWVVMEAGLDWDQARQHLRDQTWQTMLEENRQRIYASGIWGVPSYRLLDPHGKELLSVWGQDRLWLVAERMRAAE